ncbi:MAG: Extradiol ring-cleavage dioxygenase class protein subunit [Anaerocolumna sp.]|jgi:4,5-DOPA dioxygenase extradiol|nr:Extradiol ring-cleavage dioxygenase class protein subunit [Anaerocolumna sp.]
MERMPALFVGHGSPMNAIEENQFVDEWKALGHKLPKPKAILVVSAHWFTDGTRVNDSDEPKTIYDMYGFPEELYKIVYNAKGIPDLAHLIRNIIDRNSTIDNSWGYDHGAWSVLHRMYPEADIPVLQLSIDRRANLREHYEIGQKLASLRDQGVLLLGSGNIVHNLAKVNWDLEGGYPWAEEFDAYIKDNILKRNDDNVIDYHLAGSCSAMAFTTLEHYAPLMYVLGASDKKENVTIFNDACVLGSLSMTGYMFE